MFTHIPIAIALFSILGTITAQTILNRDFFTVPDGMKFRKCTAQDIGNINLSMEGTGAYWDCSSMKLEEADVIYAFDKFPDSNQLFSKGTFTLTAIEGGASSSAFELYTMTDGVLLLRGFGIFNEMGNSSPQYFDVPIPMLRFPWVLGESFYVEQQNRIGTKVMNAHGMLTLPGDSPKQAFKFKESYRDGNSFYEEHTWYVDSLPFPILTIRDQFLVEDSSLFLRTIDMLKKPSTASSIEDHNTSESLFPIWHNKMLHLPENYTLHALYSLKGEFIPFTETMPGVYQVLHPSHAMFILFADSQKRIHSQILPIIQ